MTHPPHLPVTWVKFSLSQCKEKTLKGSPGTAGLSLRGWICPGFPPWTEKCNSCIPIFLFLFLFLFLLATGSVWCLCCPLQRFHCLPSHRTGNKDPSARSKVTSTHKITQAFRVPPPPKPQRVRFKNYFLLQQLGSDNNDKIQTVILTFWMANLRTTFKYLQAERGRSPIQVLKCGYLGRDRQGEQQAVLAVKGLQASVGKDCSQI